MVQCLTHNVENNDQVSTISKRCTNNGDPVLVENYLQHADHYSRRLKELNERNKNSNIENKTSSSTDVSIKDTPKINLIKIKDLAYFLNLDNLRSILILANSIFSLPFKIFPEGSFSF